MLSSCQYVNKLAICKLLHRDQVETSEVMCEAYSEISLLGVSWLRTEQRYLLSCCGFSGDERTSGKINIARRRVAGNCTLVQSQQISTVHKTVHWSAVWSVSGQYLTLIVCVMETHSPSTVKREGYCANLSLTTLHCTVLL